MLDLAAPKVAPDFSWFDDDGEHGSFAALHVK
jgi:hypothetical protein